MRVDPSGACRPGGPYTALWLPFHPQKGSLALPVLRACFLQSSFHPKPRGGLGSAGRRQEQELRRNGRGEEAADGRSIRDSGKSNFLGLAKEVAGRGGGVTGQRTGRGSAPPRTKPGVETQHPHLGAFTLVSDLSPSPEPRKSSG